MMVAGVETLHPEGPTLAYLTLPSVWVSWTVTHRGHPELRPSHSTVLGLHMGFTP